MIKSKALFSNVTSIYKETVPRFVQLMLLWIKWPSVSIDDLQWGILEGQNTIL